MSDPLNDREKQYAAKMQAAYAAAANGDEKWETLLADAQKFAAESTPAPKVPAAQFAAEEPPKGNDPLEKEGDLSLEEIEKMLSQSEGETETAKEGIKEKEMQHSAKAAPSASVNPNAPTAEQFAAMATMVKGLEAKLARAEFEKFLGEQKAGGIRFSAEQEKVLNKLWEQTFAAGGDVSGTLREFVSLMPKGELEGSPASFGTIIGANDPMFAAGHQQARANTAAEDLAKVSEVCTRFNVGPEDLKLAGLVGAAVNNKRK
jgi:hypothetical protein